MIRLNYFYINLFSYKLLKVVFINSHGEFIKIRKYFIDMIISFFFYRQRNIIYLKECKQYSNLYTLEFRIYDTKTSTTDTTHQNYTSTRKRHLLPPCVWNQDSNFNTIYQIYIYI